MNESYNNVPRKIPVDNEGDKGAVTLAVSILQIATTKAIQITTNPENIWKIALLDKISTFKTMKPHQDYPISN